MDMNCIVTLLFPSCYPSCLYSLYDDQNTRKRGYIVAKCFINIINVGVLECAEHLWRMYILWVNDIRLTCVVLFGFDYLKT